MMPTLADALDAALRPGLTRARVGGVEAEVDVADADRLGVSARHVRVRAGGIGVLRAAERLPGALDVLPERVAPVEVSPELGGAVLRSPARKREFFEVRTDGREATVERLRTTPEGREKVPFTLTREQLGRLVEEVGGVLGGEVGGIGGE